MNELSLQPRKIISLILLIFLIGIANAAVTANFTADVTYSVTNPVTVHFTNYSVCDPACTNWVWDFNGDGVVDSYDQNPTYIFTAPGNYSPRLMASNDYNTGMKIRIHYITVGPAFIPPTPAPHPTWGPSYHDVNGTAFSFKMDTNPDIQNSTYLKYWLPNFTATKNFSTMAFATSLVAPIMTVFGFWIFLIIWALYLFAVWIRTGDVTLPLIIGILTIGIFGVLFPKESLPVIIIMFVVCGAIVVTKLLKE